MGALSLSKEPGLMVRRLTGKNRPTSQVDRHVLYPERAVTEQCVDCRSVQPLEVPDCLPASGSKEETAAFRRHGCHYHCN